MKDPYLYTNSEVLKNLAGIHDAEELKNMEADYTLLRLSEIAEGDSLERFISKHFADFIIGFFRMYTNGLENRE